MTRACAPTNGGSEPFGAKACSNDSFWNDCTTPTNTFKYKATTGYLTLSDEKADKDGKPDDAAHGAASPMPEAGKPKAKVFFIAYTKEGGDPTTRPITFSFNGGPGSASIWPRPR